MSVRLWWHMKRSQLPLIRVTEELFWKGPHKPTQRIENSYSLHKSWWLLCCLTFSTTQNQCLSQHPSPPLHKQQDTKFTAVRKITHKYIFDLNSLFVKSWELAYIQLWRKTSSSTWALALILVTRCWLGRLGGLQSQFKELFHWGP